MYFRNLHRWDVSPEEAIEIQKQLRSQLDLHGDPPSIQTVAGIDVSYDIGSDWLFAAIVILRFPELRIVETATATATVPFPYIPGLLSFRECPAVLQAWDKLRIRPDCLICDGQGIAHPRRLGIASHLGLIVDVPAIGCAKSLLVGAYREPGSERGSRTPLVHHGERVGMILRTRDKVQPVYVSQGHKISLQKACEVILACCTRYRLPETTRRAHRLVNEMRREVDKSI